ncbi:MAG: deoxyguanosinetriphosphate triphosphohydrolase [Alphaproteobacteria bacterium]|nr:deoxyguanosinetriphosphate triphosphohydrolase [Alphaproteobacteria bacterium]
MVSSPPVAARPPYAGFACRPDLSRGRLLPEPESALRTAFQRDRDRVIHSTAFRRLKHKTQVFIYHEGDHYRTRLTHSIEVAQIARTLARSLAVDEDLAEVVALAHDLGHTPFGHTGEDALDEVMAPFGGFDHNAQTLRILTRLEQRYAAFDGLNLTWETLEGVVKHNGPLVGEGATRRRPLPAAIQDYAAQQDLWLDTWPGLEAQLAALADDIAYNSHDIDDGLRAGLFGIEDLRDVPLVGPVVAAVEARHPGLALSRFIGETMRRMIDAMVSDLLAATVARLRTSRADTADDVRRAGAASAIFSPSMHESMQGLRTFLHARMYRHERVNRVRVQARAVVQELFQTFMNRPDRLPAEWHMRVTAGNDLKTARLVADYIAGMTDKFAFEEHGRLCG